MEMVRVEVGDLDLGEGEEEVVEEVGEALEEEMV